MNHHLVYKFGGTSVGSSKTIMGAANIVTNSNNKVVVIVSAMGGTTDKLLSAAREAVTGNLQPAQVASTEFSKRHFEAIRNLIKDPVRAKFLNNLIRESTDEFNAICKSLKVLKEHTPRILDATVARGERMMARLLTATLQEMGKNAAFLDATEIISVEKKFGVMIPNIKACELAAKKILFPLLETTDYVIIPGYIASGPDSEVVTLGRGGSDYSATILASCIDADSVTLFKEVDGLLTTDPKLVPNARVIPSLHYREATELAYYGAKVLHPRTIIPLLEKKIPLIIKNSFSPEFPGSIISGDAVTDGYPVKALTAIRNQTLITVEGNAMMGVPGIAGRVFTAMAQENISISVISQASSEASICFIVPEEESNTAKTILEELFHYEIEHKLISSIKCQKNLAVIAVVGMGMKGAPGIAARTFSALSEQNVNICTIAQGSSELNISFAIEEADLEKSLISLHREYQLEKLRPLPDRNGKRIEVNIFGFGQIGTTLAEQIIQQSNYFETTLQMECICTSLTDRSGTEVAESGFLPKDLKNRIVSKRTGQSLIQIESPPSSEALLSSIRENIFRLPLHKGVFADLTAEDTAPIILEAINNGFHIVLANKKPLAVKQEDFDEMLNAAKDKGVWLRYEATVGAGLPILDTLAKLESTGDKVESILGCLSGTLGYLMTRLEDGAKFSQAVADAYRAGYTEPDPREDLSGMDVARKALILSRTLGRRINMDQIDLEPLFSADISDDDPQKFISNLKSLDEEFAEKIAKASAENCVLRYVARLENDRVSVGIEAVPTSSPLGRLRGTDNQLTIKTKRYNSNPLIVTGPGAGAEVTAAGVLNDIVAIAMAEKIMPRS